MTFHLDLLEAGWISLSLLGGIRSWYALQISRSDIRIHREEGVNGPVAAAAELAKWRVAIHLFLQMSMMMAGALSAIRPPDPGPTAYDASRVALITFLYLVNIGIWVATELELRGREHIKRARREELSDGKPSPNRRPA